MLNVLYEPSHFIEDKAQNKPSGIYAFLEFKIQLKQSKQAEMDFSFS